jgi:hypothetical protein
MLIAFLTILLLVLLFGVRGLAGILRGVLAFVVFLALLGVLLLGA